MLKVMANLAQIPVQVLGNCINPKHQHSRL